MKILLLIDSTDVRNGYGRYASGLMATIKGAGHEVVFLPHLRRGWHAIGDIFRVRRAIQSVDLVHALDVYPFCIIGWLANIGIRKPLVLSMQGTYSVAPLHRWTTAWLSRRAAYSADAVTAISHYTRDQVAGAIPGLTITVINHGFWYKDFSVAHQGYGSGIVLSVGALKYRKGYHISIPAFAAAHQNNSRLRYVIVGSQRDQSYVQRLRELVRVHDISSVVEFKEHIADDELKALYARAEVFLLPSVNQADHFEGFGLVFLEAAAAGVPQVGTLNNGIADAVDEGRSGILVRQDDVQKTADALQVITANREAWEVMSVYSKKWAETHDWSHIGPHYLQIYSHLLK